MSRFSERSPRRDKFKVGIPDQLRAAWSRLPWPSPGQGEVDDSARNQDFFRSYLTYARKSADPGDSGHFKDYGAILPAVDVLDMPFDFESAQVMNIPFAVEPTPANSIRTAVSIPIFGPAFIQSWWGRFEVVAGTANPTFSIFVGETADAVNNTRPAGDCIMEFTALTAGVTAPPTRDGVVLPVQTEALLIDRTIGRKVNLQRFFLKFSMATTTVGAGTNPNVIGSLRLLFWGPDRIGGTRAQRRLPDR